MKPLHSLLVVGLLAAPSLAHNGHAAPDDAEHATWRVEGEHRVVESSGLPDHEPGEFPNQGNPNAIRPQAHEFRMPMEPTRLERPRSAQGWTFGVAINGVPFDPFTGETWQGDRDWRYEALTGGPTLGMDGHNAHVQPTGNYHYHGLPTGLVQRLEAEQDEPLMLLIGYAADGFPMYANVAHEDADDAESPLVVMTPNWRIRPGARPGGPGNAHDGLFVQDWEYVEGLGDLDECNGRVGVTPEFPEGTYYYIVSEAYPFVPRFFRGEPDESFRKRRGGPGGPGMNERRGNRPPPREGRGGRRQGPPRR
jgi:hypothetical protein